VSNSSGPRRERAGVGLDRTLAALADPRRREVVDLLRSGPRQAGDLARALNLPAPAMSRHLRALKAGGLVEESHPAFDARVRIYRLRPQPIIALMRWLDETQTMWSEQLLAFKEHVEGREETK